MKYTTSFLLLLTTFFMAFLWYSHKQPAEQQQTIEKVSGAYQALSFMGARQTFPTGQIPEYAYTKAWDVMQRMPTAAASQRTETDPWESMGPHNRGGRTLAIAFNPQNANTLYAGSASGGLWRSYTASIGLNAWEYIDTGFPVLGVSCITFIPNDSMTMYIGTGEVYNFFEAGTGAAYRNTRGSFGIGILKTTDGGQTWEKSLDWSMDENHGVWTIRVDPFDHDVLYAATTQGVYKTTDGGASWVLKLDVPMANDLLVHQATPSLILVGCGNLDSADKGIYRSTDGGENWIKITTNIPDYGGKVQFGAAPSSPSVVYASIGNSLGGDTQASWLCRSTNFGQNWTVVNQTDYSRWQGWFSHNVAVHPTDPDKITIIGINVWNSTNGGQNITQISSGGVGFANPPLAGPDGDPDYVHSDAHDLLYHPNDPNTIYIASDGGIHYTTNGGISYTSGNSGYQTTQFYNGFSNSQQDATFCMGGLQDNGTIRWNGDKTWTRVLGGDGSWTAIDTENDNIWYTSWQHLNMVGTQDDGENGLLLYPPRVGAPSFIAPYVLAPSRPEVLYAASAAVAKTTDRGNTWEVTNNGNELDPASNPILSMAVSYYDENVVYAATAPLDETPAKVFRTINGGNTWINITTDNLPNRYPMDLAVDPSNHNIGYIAYAGFGSGHVYKTTNLGLTWTDISADLPDVPTNAVIVDPLFPNNIYVGNDLGVFVSPDGGETWERYQDGLPSAVMVFDLKISPDNRKLRIATHGNGAYERDLIETPVSTENLLQADRLKINIYPNPLSDIANVHFELQDAATVSFSILDANGRFIKNILNQQQLPSGKQTFHFEVNELVRGFYYLQMQANDKVLFRKIILE